MRGLIILALLVLSVVLIGCQAGFSGVNYNCSVTKNLSLSFDTCNPENIWDFWTASKCEYMGEKLAEISYVSPCFIR
ncbi:hypothetical protein HY638_02495 [Candidatus Woesearchaeota archaeon]|nr:hypothetical protein [Candidatus Woesearchaeota archaeon]